ncbi:MAG: DUF4912 domain-containing protein [Planctomycetaceae bacterium]
MTEDFLTTRTRKELAMLARRHRVGGWHSMKKAELVQAIIDARDRRSRQQSERARRRRLAAAASAECAPALRRPDRILADEIDSYWIHVRWEIGRRGVRRAEAALGTDWHRAVPALRVFDVTPDDGASAARRLVGQVDIHSNTDQWFVPVTNPPRDYEVEIGYRTTGDRFHSLARSRRVRTSRPESRVTADAAGNAAEPYRPARVRSPGGDAPPMRAGGNNGSNGGGSRPFEFTLDAELVVHGVTHPHAETTLLGQPVRPDRDGAFSLRLTLPEGRQIIPAVAIAPDGSEQRTIVLSIERNTRELEPQPLEDEFQTG